MRGGKQRRMPAVGAVADGVGAEPVLWRAALPAGGPNSRHSPFSERVYRNGARFFS